MAKLIGTAGHVDHGKTTLIRALTGIDADRLPEEKARGMTIDVGFAFLDLPGHGRVSIVDVPGHEKFLHNLLVGALGIDVALLCVSADESVMPQTREHLQILELLPVDAMVVALTRVDLADQETREFATEELRELLLPTRFAEAQIVPVSAQTGEGLQGLREALSRALEGNSELKNGTSGDSDWYLPIDRSFSVKGQGLVVTGTMARGHVKVGDKAVLEPGGVEVRIRSIHHHGEAAAEGEVGQRTALNLGGVRREDVQRGMALGAPGALFETRVLDASMKWLAKPKHGERIRLSIGAEEAIGRVFFGAEEGKIGQFRLESSVAVALGQPLVVRRYSPPDLLGGGRVVVPQARARRKGEQVGTVGVASEEEAVLAAIGDSVNGTPTEEVCRLVGRTPQALGGVFERLVLEGKALGFAGLWFTPESFEAGASALLESLRAEHAKRPLEAWQPRERAVSGARLTWSGKPLDRIVSSLAASGRIDAQGTSVRHSEFRLQLTPRQRDFLDRVREAIAAEPVNTPNPHQLSLTLHVPLPAVEEILKLGMQAGEIVSLGEGIYYTPAQIEALKERIQTLAGGKPFAASAIRDGLGTTRKYTIPLLEHMDSLRFTTRVGDLRAVNEKR